MVKKETCIKCRGAKTVRGMGGISKVCPECKGVGVIEVGCDDENVGSSESCNSSQSANLSDVAAKGLQAEQLVVNESGIKPSDASVTTDGVACKVDSEASGNVDEKALVEDIVEAKEEKAPEVKVDPAQELGKISGYTPLMIEAIMAETRMKPDEWRKKYASVIADPLSVPQPGRQCLPDLQGRARFRESVGRAQKPAKRKHNTMATHDIAGKLEGIE